MTDPNTLQSTSSDVDDLPPVEGERHVLQAESELRLEVSSKSSCQVVLQRGSCELWGVELALKTTYSFTPNSKLALFTWHGCVIDVESDDDELFSYVSDETQCNIAFVNTHAQLEALRDEALQNQTEGPRVLVVGPSESGKSSLSRILVAYATKLGRTPLWVDLDPADNALSVPGTLAVAPISSVASLLVESVTSVVDTTPLVLWYGSTLLDDSHKDLFQAQVTALGHKIDQRLQSDTDASRASGVIVNTNGWFQDEGYQLLLHTVQALRITVVLILGHDRLYSMLKSHYDKQSKADDADSTSISPKIIKLPRSGGVVSRDVSFRRMQRSQAVKRYFYGETSANNKMPKLTPFLAHVPFDKVTIYKWSSVALSASLLPVSAKQSTEPVQLAPVTISEKLQHSLLAVCHPMAVHAYEQSGMARDLYASGVAGFVVVERVLMDAEKLHLLSPCAGSLPSYTLIQGDITWME